MPPATSLRKGQAPWRKGSLTLPARKGRPRAQALGQMEQRNVLRHIQTLTSQVRCAEPPGFSRGEDVSQFYFAFSHSDPPVNLLYHQRKYFIK